LVLSRSASCLSTRARMCKALHVKGAYAVSLEPGVVGRIEYPDALNVARIVRMSALWPLRSMSPLPVHSRMPHAVRLHFRRCADGEGSVIKTKFAN
jgi:hypothetical protein